MATRQRGLVIHVNKDKGWGKIRRLATGTNEIYVHASGFSEGDFNRVVEGVHVTYNPRKNNLGRIAKDVVLVKETTTICGECVQLSYSADNEVVAAGIVPDDYEGRAEDAGIRHGKLWAQASDFEIEVALVSVGRRVRFSKASCLVRSGTRDFRRTVKIFDVTLETPPDGLDKWRGGENGWVYGGQLSKLAHDNNQLVALGHRRACVLALNELQKQFKDVMESLSHNSNVANLFNAFPDEPQPGRLPYLWSKTSRDTDLQDAVRSARLVLERLAYLDKQVGAWETYLRGDDEERRHQRWCVVAKHVKYLLRSAKQGPDGPVQWAGHGQWNPYRYTKVTDRSIIEIVEKLGVILKELFKGRIFVNRRSPRVLKVMPRAVAFALEQAFAAPPVLEGRAHINRTGPNVGSPSRNQRMNGPEKVFKAWMFLFQFRVENVRGPWDLILDYAGHQ